jgi:hypothetical protein
MFAPRERFQALKSGFSDPRSGKGIRTKGCPTSGKKLSKMPENS